MPRSSSKKQYTVESGSMANSSQKARAPKRSLPVDVADLRPSDTLIAVMGMTGVGKSTFISHCTDVHVPIGHEMVSCTQEVVVYPCRHFGTRRVFLVDTPGFDDTYRSDTQVLTEIATWLTDTFSENVQLSGIVYLHRISDNRVQGSAIRNLFMFKKLCGNEVFQKVRLTTTMWETSTGSTGDDRERVLIENNDFWGYMIQKGAKTYRHYNSRESALKLIEKLLGTGEEDSKLTLRLQMEMKAGATLEETGAGQEVDYQLRKIKDKYRQEIEGLKAMQQEAMAQNEKESARQMQIMQDSYVERIASLDKGREQLRADMEKLHRDRVEMLTRRLNEQDEMISKLKSQIDNSNQQERLHLQEQIDTERVRSKYLDQQVKSMRERVRQRAYSETKKGIRYNCTRRGCSLAIYNTDFALVALNHSRTNYADLENRCHSTDDDTMFFTFGEQQSWYRHFHRNNECKHETSSNFATFYPDLFEHLNSDRKAACPISVALGLDGTYYFADKKSQLMYLTRAQRRYLKKKLGKGYPAQMRRVWLGVGDTLVCNDYSREVHYFSSSSVNYPDLRTSLDEHRHARTPRNIKAIALSLTDRTCWLAAWTYQHDYRLGKTDFAANHFGTWCKLNQGTISYSKDNRAASKEDYS